MSDYTKEELDEIWLKGCEVDGLDAATYRKDVVGALMRRDRYGKEGNLGWEVDHILPIEKLKGYKVPEARWNDMANLRPFNAKNNAAKGDDYPTYSVAVQYDENLGANKEVNKISTIREDVQAQIASVYARWL